MSAQTKQEKDPAVLERLREARNLQKQHAAAFAEAVRSAVANRRGYTVRELAEAAGISRERIYQIARQ